MSTSHSRLFPRKRCIVVALALLAGAACLALAQTTGSPGATDQKPVRTEAKVRAPKPERVSFETDDKTPVTIVGSYTAPPESTRGARAPMAILLHMYQENRKSFDPLVPVLHEAGFAVLAIDLRGHGESVTPASLKLAARVEDRDPRLFREMTKDVEAAYRWLSRRNEVDASRFVLVGASIGASVSLEYAARDKSVDGVVLMSPGLDYMDLDSRASARKYGARAALLLAADEERGAADDLARLIPEAKVKAVGARAAGEHSMALHGTRMFGKVPAVEKTIADFLVQAAGAPTQEPVVASMIGEVYYEPGSNQADQLSPDNRRTFSSAAEAQARGYRASKRPAKK